MQKSRTPLTIGWEAARANAVPALIIQAIMLALLVAYYTNHAAFSALNQLANYKRTHGLVLVIAASIAAGALIPVNRRRRAYSGDFFNSFLSTRTPKFAESSEPALYGPGLGI